MATHDSPADPALAFADVDWRRREVQDRFDTLCGDRDFAALARLTELAARYSPESPRLRRLQAQALVETGLAAAAADVAAVAVRDLDPDHEEWPELQGMLGRAAKQMFVEAAGADPDVRRRLIERAIAAYRDGYEADRGRYWHGVNLLALQWRANRDGLGGVALHSLQAFAADLRAVANLDADTSGSPWALATIVEAGIPLLDLAATEAAVHDFLAAKNLRPFHVGSLLRQLTQVWQLARLGDGWAGIVAALQAVHGRMPGADPTLLPAAAIRRDRLGYDDALGVQFERIIGKEGMKTYHWWRLALQRTDGVAAVREPDGGTIGTAFAVDGGALSPKWATRTVMLTNFHVVNTHGVRPALRPDDASLVFEAVDPDDAYRIARVLWESPQDEFDCAVLLLDREPPAGRAMPIARHLPAVAGEEDAGPARVFIIGHPNGRGLEFSINDNELICHDGDAGGPVTRLHYLAPTEGGSSGSPVFRSNGWEALAIHHGYTRTPLDKRTGHYEANEGIGLQSIRAKLASLGDGLPDIDAA